MCPSSVSPVFFIPHILITYIQGLEALEEGLRAAAVRERQASLALEEMIRRAAQAAQAAAAAAAQDPYACWDGTLY